MADDDLFIDNEKLQKMIALGIYDESMADKMKKIKNKDFKNVDSAIRQSAPERPAADRPLDRRMDRQSQPFEDRFSQRPGPYGMHSRGRDRGRGRGDRGRGRGFAPLGKFGAQSKYNWQEIDADREDVPKGDTFRTDFRDGIRDGIQNKIQRNEIERKMNLDFMDETPAGNQSTDEDLRPKSDVDSRIRDTDLRPATHPINSTKTSSNLTHFSSAATDQDFRQSAAGDGLYQMRGKPSKRGKLTKEEMDRLFFGNKAESSATAPKNPIHDDIDDFIQKASQRLDLRREEIPDLLAQRGRPQYPRGRGGPQQYSRGRGGQQYQRPHPYNRNEEFNNTLNNDPLGLNQSDEAFREQHPDIDDNFDSNPVMIDSSPEVEELNPMAILKETVEELSKSNLYCQYCDCYLSSLIEVNTHIGTALHKQNMTQKTIEENKGSDNQRASALLSTTIERAPTGIAAIVEMIERKQKITLKSLTELDNYEIKSDSEASLAKELAKLLTNELLNYKMNLMPDNVKEALKHQGIGLLDSIVKNG